jgi:hypothetical protein
MHLQWIEYFQRRPMHVCALIWRNWWMVNKIDLFNVWSQMLNSWPSTKAFANS